MRRDKPHPQQLPNNYSRLIVFVLAISMLIIGILIVPNYGESTDEYLYKTYAQQVLEIVGGIRETSDTLTNLRYYGPVFSVSSLVLARFLSRIVTDWTVDIAVRFTYYLTLITAVAGLFWIGRRFVGVLASTFTVLLLATQPVIFGHAFINPKDVPFMAAVIISILLGLMAIDAYENKQKHVITSNLQFGDICSLVKDRWRASNRKNQIKLISLFIVTLIYLYSIGSGYWSRTVSSIIESAYQQTAWAPITAFFNAAAKDAWKSELIAYQNKALMVLPWILFLFGTALLSTILIQLNCVFGTRSLLQEMRKQQGWGLLFLAGISFGLTTSIRVGGLIVLLLFFPLWLIKFKKRAVVPLFVYALTGMVTTYVTWPFLWNQPLRNGIEVLILMMNFTHPATQLFEGQYYHSWELPRRFLPKIMLIQFTLPLVLFSIIGFASGLLQLFKGKLRKTDEVFFIAMWFLFPMTVYLITRTPIYNNFRHVFFITPPVFIFAGIGLDILQRALKSKLLIIILGIAMLLPGLFAIIRLHPYEYIYYNELVGGVAGAKDDYHLDYLCSSYAEGTRYINTYAQPGETIAVAWEKHLVNPYIRDDLVLHEVRTEEDLIRSNPDYLITCTRFPELAPYAPIIFSVERERGVLTTIKELRGSNVDQ
jgi:hypothetical protein